MRLPPHMTIPMRFIFFVSLLSIACQPMEAWEDKLDDSWVNSYRSVDGEERREVWSLCDDREDLGWIRWPTQDDGDHTPKAEIIDGDVRLSEAREESVLLVVKGEHQADDGEHTDGVRREEMLWTEDWDTFQLGDSGRKAAIFPCPVELPD